MVAKELEKDLLIQENFIIDFRRDIGVLVKQSRERIGHSQDDLADLLKIKRSTISKIENGKFAFTIDFLAKLSFYLNFEIKFSYL